MNTPIPFDFDAAALDYTAAGRLDNNEEEPQDTQPENCAIGRVISFFYPFAA